MSKKIPSIVPLVATLFGLLMIVGLIVIAPMIYWSVFSPLNAANYNRIQPKMTVAEVESILGKPERSAQGVVDLRPPKMWSSSDGQELKLNKQTLIWKSGDRSIKIEFLEGKLFTKTQTGIL